MDPPLLEPPHGGFYVDDLPFDSGVVSEYAPLHMAFVAALGGFAPPPVYQPFHYCDLGCGDGTTIIAHAACYPHGEFWGIDFNPEHIERGRDLARQAGIENVHFLKASFDELETLNLPDFHYAAMGGIYSWLEVAQLVSVQAFLKTKLCSVGLFIVNYASLPGKAQIAPIWRILQWLFPSDGMDSFGRGRAALRFLDGLAKCQPLYTENSPIAAQLINGWIARGFTEENVRNFVHNSLASGFRPRFFFEIVEELRAAGLEVVGRGPVALNFTELSVLPEHLAVLRKCRNPVESEVLKDVMRNEQVRTDVFGKQGTRNPEAARRFLLEEVLYATRRPLHAQTRDVKVLKDYRVKLTGLKYDDLSKACAGHGQRLADLTPAPAEQDSYLIAAAFLVASGDLAPCLLPARETDRIRSQPPTFVHKINDVFLERAVHRGNGTQLVSPATGGTVAFFNAIEVILLDGVLRD